MGNIAVKDKFKDYKRDDPSKKPLGFSSEIISEPDLTEIFYEIIKKTMMDDSADFDALFKVKNEQKNELEDGHFQLSLLAELNENYISGFATAENNIKTLREANFEKYFIVVKDTDVQEFTELQRKKFLTLYGLFTAKFEGKSGDQTFFEYIDKFLTKEVSPETQRVSVGLEGGLKFTLAVLKEIRTINPAILESTLQHLLQALTDAAPGSMYSTDQLAFQSDANLNDARSFLTTLIEDKSTPFPAVQLSYKIIVRLGIVRSNPEDYLVAISLLDANEQHAKKVDLRAELRALPNSDGAASSQASSSADATQRFDEKKGPLRQQIFWYKDVETSLAKSSLVCDGKYLYLYVNGEGLSKLSMGDGDRMAGMVVDQNKDYSWGDNAHMLLYKGKLYVRHEKNDEKPFLIIDPTNLKEDSEAAEKIKFSDEEDATTLAWMESKDAKTGRELTSSPFFSEGQYFYAVSLKHDVTKDQGDDYEPQPTALVVEVFDPSTEKFDFVRSVTLYKNEQKDLFVKNNNDQAFLDGTQFFTNGKTLVLRIKRNSKFYNHVFNLETGVRVFKDELNFKDDVWTFDFGAVAYNSADSSFYQVANTKYLEESESKDFLTQFTLNNFTSGAAEVSSKDGEAAVVAPPVSVIEGFRKEYFGEAGSRQQGTLNVVQRIMKRKGGALPKETTEAAPAAASLAKVILLDHVKNQCKKFELALLEETVKQSAKSSKFIDFFKFPGATYLTFEFFERIQGLLSKFNSSLVKAKKTRDTLHEQYSFLYTLHILSANFKALGFCGVQLPDLMEEAEYKQFLNVYQSSIVKMIEDGYSKDFEEGAERVGEIKSLWAEIYTSCQDILANSMDLIYSETKEIVSTLDETLHNLTNEKQEENASFGLRYLSKPHNTAKLFATTEQKNLDQFVHLFTRCSQLLSTWYDNTISKNRYAEDFPEDDEGSILIQACKGFVSAVSERLLIQVASLRRDIASEKKSKTSENEKKAAQIQQIEDIASIVYKCLADQLSTQVAAAQRALTETVSKKDRDFFDEKAATLYVSFSKRVFQMIYSSTTSLQLYITALPDLCKNLVLVSSVTNSSISLIKDLCQYADVVTKKYGKLLRGKGAESDNESDEDEEENADDQFLKSIQDLTRRLSWFVGHLSFNLIQVKSTQLSSEKEKSETQIQKMERMLMDSKLLSGGIESRFLHNFKTSVKDEIRNILQISKDFTISELVEVGSESSEDTMYDQIMHQGKNEFVDRLIDVLQDILIRKGAKFAYARLGGADAARIHRAAFAVMIKFASLSNEFETLVDEVDMAMSEVESEDPHEIKLHLKDALRDNPSLKGVALEWENAGQMRMWLTEKKKNLGDKFDKQEKSAFLKKKRDELEKKKAEEQKKKEEEEKAAEEAEAAAEKKEGDASKDDKNKQEKKEEKKEEEKKEVEQIDTTAKKDKDAKDKGDDKKEKKEGDEDKEDEDKEDEDEEEEIVITEEDEAKIKASADALYDKSLNEIIGKIVEKAEYILKMQVPTAYKFGQDKKQGSLSSLSLIQAPSYVAASEQAADSEAAPAQDWASPFKQWQESQTADGSIKSDIQLRKEILETGTLSVLSCLQTPITAQKIEKRVEEMFLSACRRVAGLHLIGQIIGQNLPKGTVGDLSNWFCAGLRDNQNKFTHYLNNIRSCGNHLEGQVRNNFFVIFKAILDQLKQTKNKTEAIRLVNALKWKFWGRDHATLCQLDVFKILRQGNGHRKNIIKRAWGRTLSQKVTKEAKEDDELTKEILTSFEHLFLTLVSRVVDSDLGQAMTVKSGGTSVPSLERSKSVIDQNVSEKLLGQAFEVLFREFDRYINNQKCFEGVDWSFYIRKRNDETKKETDPEKYLEELLFDEDEEEKTYQKKKEEKQKAKEEAEAKKAEEEEKAKEAKENKDADKEGEEKTEEEKKSADGDAETAEATTDAPAEEGEDKKEEEEKKEGDEEEEKKDTESNKDKDEDEDKNSDEENEEDAEAKKEAEKIAAEQQLLVDATEIINEMGIAEMKNIFKLYQENFLRRLLRLVEIFTSIAVSSQYPLSMVQRVANPFMLYTLLNMLIVSSPRSKFTALQIVQNLIKIGIPSQVFEATVDMIADNEKCQAYKVLTEVTTDVKFGDSKFLNFFFKYLISLRQSMFTKNQVQSEGAYEICQEISRIFTGILKDEKHHLEEWNQTILATFKESLLNAEKLTEAEIDTIFGMQVGAEFQRVSIGTRVTTSQDQLLTVLGYTEKKVAGELSEADLKDHKLSQYYSNEKQRIVGLFYDPNTKERQEIIQVAPFDVKPVLDLDKDMLKIVASSSVLMDPVVLKHLIPILVSEEAKNKNSALKVQILKVLTALMEILNKKFFVYLQEHSLLEPLISFLQKTASSSKKEDKNSDGGVLPLPWLEAKATNLRVLALESNRQLSIDQSFTASILDNKQLVFTLTDKETNDILALNAFLLSAINLQKVGKDSRFSVHLSPQDACHRLTKSSIQNGLVFVDSEEVLKLEDDVLKLMQSSQAIITHDVSAKELFKKMVEKAKPSEDDDDEEDEDGKKKEKPDWKWVLQCVVFIVSKGDFDDIKNAGAKDSQWPIKQEWRANTTLSDVDFFMQQLEVWGGIDTSKLLYHFTQLEEITLESMQSNLVDIIETIQKEETEYSEKIKNIEKDGNEDKLKEEKAKQVELEKKRAEEVEKKRKDIFVSSKTVSIIEELSKKAAIEKVELSDDIKILNLLDFDKKNVVEKLILPVIDDQIAVASNAGSQEEVAKTEDAMCKQYFKEINSFEPQTISKDYESTMKDLLVQQSNVALLDILKSGDLSVLLPILLKNAESRKRLSLFIKVSHNQACLTRAATGQKAEQKSLKKNFRRFFKFCLKEGGPEAEKFVQEFIYEDIIKAGNLTLEKTKLEKSQGTKQYFKTEEIAVQQLNPFLLKFVVSLLLENRPAFFTESKSLLPAFFSLSVSFLVKFWSKSEERLAIRLLNSMMHMIFFAQEQIETFGPSGVLEGLVNHPLVTKIVSKIDYDNSKDDKKFSEVQKLLLEVYLGLINLHNVGIEQKVITFDKILETTKGISQAKRGMTIVREKEAFTFLRYFIHQQELKEHELKMMNQHYETQHPSFDVQTVGRYNIDQVERITIQINDKSEFKPLTYMGISSTPDGSDIELYSKEDLKKKDKFEFNRSHFYTFYPYKQQMAVGMGEAKRNRTSTPSLADTPSLIEKTKDLHPVQVYASKNHSMIVNNKGEIYVTGEKCGSDKAEYEQAPLPGKENEKSPIKQISVGPHQRFVLCEDSTVFYTGTSKQFSLPEDKNCSSWTKFKLSQDKLFKDEIVHVSCGNAFNLFVTNKGKVWGTGNKFLKKIGLESEVPIQLPLKEELHATRAWAGQQGNSQSLAIIEVKNADGDFQLFSAGANEQGLLGQGGKTKETKIFQAVNYDFKNVKFEQISLGFDHAVAIDAEGNLWAWGSNLMHASGFPQEIIDGVYSPTKVPFLQENNLQALKVSAGRDHTLLLAKDKGTNTVRLYSIGKDAGNFKHLGCSQKEAGENVFREISIFSDFEIVDFSASAKYAIVIIGGEKHKGKYVHSLPDGSEATGLLHFFKKEGKWTFISEDKLDEAEKAGTLPDISFAIKAPLKDMQTVLDDKNALPDLAELNVAANFDASVKDGSHPDVKSSISSKVIQGARYFTFTKINGDDIKLNLSLDEVRNQIHQHDVNPQVYFRLNRALQKSVRLPLIDLKQVYPQTQKHGFHIEVTPDTSYLINDKLIELTEEDYNEFVETIKKFPVEGDKELIKEMNKQFESLDKEIKVLDPVKDFTVADMTFKNEKMKKVSENIKKQRLRLYWAFNKSFVGMFPYLVNNPVKPFKGQKVKNDSAASLFNEVKLMVLTAVKMKFVDSAIAALPTGSQTSVSIKRNSAMRFEESGQQDHTGEFTIFGQIYRYLDKQTSGKFDCFFKNNVDDMAYSASFKGEGSIDVGGPYRETLTNLVRDMESGCLPLFIKSPNNRTDHGDNRECFVVDSSSKTPTHAELFKFAGILIGYAFRSKSCMPYNFPPSFWKSLINEKLTEADLNDFDTYAFQAIADMRKLAKTKTDEEFTQGVDQTFTTLLNNKQEVDLLPGGSNMMVTRKNLEQYIRLMTQKRLQEGEQQIEWIRQGMYKVCPKNILNMLEWEEIEIRASGDKVVDVEKLKKITEYYGDSECKTVKLFWEMMENFDEDQKQKYLKFTWGRQRLPADCSDLRYKHTICILDSGDDRMPEGHTCFFQIDVPKYSTLEIMTKRFITAIEFCGEIDTDYGADQVQNESDDEGSDY